NVAGPAGALLVLDDLQWAGPDALDLLATLARSAVPSPPQAWGPRAGARPLRVVGAYRDTEVGPQEPLAALLADLAHGGLALHRALAPLPRHEAERLLDGLLEGVEDSTA